MATPKSRYITIFILLIVLFSTAIVFLYTREQTVAFWSNKGSEEELREKSDSASSSEAILKKKKEEKDKTKLVNIEPGVNYIDLMKDNGLDYSQAMNIYNVAKDKYDLADLNAGKSLELIYAPEGELKKIIYEINTKDRLVIKNTEFCEDENVASSSVSNNHEKQDWVTEVKPIPYNIKVEVVEGTIENSLYKSALDKGLDERTIIKFAEAFQWTVDFAMEVRKGDTFKLVYEKKYLDGKYIRPGRILAAGYVNDGEKHELFYYEESEDNAGHFTYEGESAQKMFLKAPVAYKYISSGYSAGPRYVARFKTFTSSHKAIDYAAEIGTPIRSVGDGVVTRAGWSSAGYGYLTTVRHNSTYTTRYAHQSRIDVSVGEKVKQGQVIGAVGSTGFSTGPHLHYEMIKNGVKINPLNLEMPAGDSIADKNMKDFHNAIKSYKQKLDQY